MSSSVPGLDELSGTSHVRAAIQGKENAAVLQTAKQKQMQRKRKYPEDEVAKPTPDRSNKKAQSVTVAKVSSSCQTIVAAIPFHLQSVDDMQESLIDEIVRMGKTCLRLERSRKETLAAEEKLAILIEIVDEKPFSFVRKVIEKLNELRNSSSFSDSLVTTVIEKLSFAPNYLYEESRRKG